MAGRSKEQLETAAAAEETSTTETGERREIYLREGRTLAIDEAGREDLVEIRSSSGQVELRIRLTEEGPVLAMESVRLNLKASESVEIEAKRVQIKASETVQIASDNEVKVEADGEVRVNGKMIYLN
ncbi:MAG TPA: hypothetical protein VGC42_30715 [Kofleriaceae bacterium]